MVSGEKNKKKNITTINCVRGEAGEGRSGGRRGGGNERQKEAINERRGA